MLGSVRKIILLLMVGLVGPAFSVPFTFTYSGRLLDTSTGSPITGTRSIKITFWTAQSGGSQLAANAQTGVTSDTYSVSLVSGVFSQTINLSAADFHTVFPDSTTGTWVQVQDMTAGTTYPRQQFTTVPYALKVPVDGTTVTYNSSGQLQVSSIGSASLPATINATTVTGSTSMGIGTTSPDANDLSFGGNVAREVLVQRHTTSNTAGSSLSLIAGGATVGATDKNGGTLILSSGTSTGTGSSSIQFQTATAGTTGTTDRSVSTKMVITGEGNLQLGASEALANSLRYLDINNLDQTATGSGVNLRLITRNVANSANVAVDVVKYRNGGFYINNNETNSNAFTSFGVAGADRMRITSDGNVGIGTASPAAKLDVAGEVKLGNTSASCSATTEGSLRYNTTLNQMEFCDGSSWAAVVQESVDPAVSGGRLTVVTGSVSVPNTTGATTLYYTPAISNKIALNNGTNWRVYSFSEFSLALSGLTSGKNYDVFVYLNNGSPALELGSAWTNDTTRASNLAFNSVYTKSGDASRKYVGTIRATGTTTTEDSDSKRFVWNFYNQRPSNFTKHTTKSDSNSAVWGYSTQAWRAFNNDTTGRVEYVTGITQSVYFSFSAVLQIAYAGLCFDCTNSSSVTVHNGDSTGYIMVGSRFEELPGIGYHFAQATEHGWNTSSGIGYITISGMIHN